MYSSCVSESSDPSNPSATAIACCTGAANCLKCCTDRWDSPTQVAANILNLTVSSESSSPTRKPACCIVCRAAKAGIAHDATTCAGVTIHAIASSPSVPPSACGNSFPRCHQAKPLILYTNSAGQITRKCGSDAQTANPPRRNRRTERGSHGRARRGSCSSRHRRSGRGGF